MLSTLSMPITDTVPTDNRVSIMASVEMREIEEPSLRPEARDTAETAPAPSPIDTLITSMVTGKLICTAACWAVPSVPTQ